tara:strand:+ start:332 stop:541 length:210 start_codon:yes stop_codon:yes gene_type:complete
MKKSGHDTTLFNKDPKIDNYSIIDKNKTTNVNILLNRVRLDKKKSLRKKIIHFFLLVTIISTVIIFAVI